MRRFNIYVLLPPDFTVEDFQNDGWQKKNKRDLYRALSVAFLYFTNFELQT